MASVTWEAARDGGYVARYNGHDLKVERLPQATPQWRALVDGIVVATAADASSARGAAAYHTGARRKP